MARVLIVDDDPALLDMQRTLLQMSGHQVSVALTAAMALREIGTADLVIVDLRLPTAADGLQLIRTIRERGSSAPVLLMSGDAEEIHGKPEESMIAGVVGKPARIPELLKKVQELTAR
jgi:DNA-binding response OmpR family regulator